MFPAGQLVNVAIVDRIHKKYVKSEKLFQHNPNTMIVSEEVWQKIHAILSNESTEVAVFLACCDRLHPELGASYSE